MSDCMCADCVIQREGSVNQLHVLSRRAEKAERERDAAITVGLDALTRETARHFPSVAMGTPCSCFLCIARRLLESLSSAGSGAGTQAPGQTVGTGHPVSVPPVPKAEDNPGREGG